MKYFAAHKTRRVLRGRKFYQPREGFEIREDEVPLFSNSFYTVYTTDCEESTKVIPVADEPENPQENNPEEEGTKGNSLGKRAVADLFK